MAAPAAAAAAAAIFWLVALASLCRIAVKRCLKGSSLLGDIPRVRTQLTTLVICSGDSRAISPTVALEAAVARFLPLAVVLAFLRAVLAVWLRNEVRLPLVVSDGTCGTGTDTTLSSIVSFVLTFATLVVDVTEAVVVVVVAPLVEPATATSWFLSPFF